MPNVICRRWKSKAFKRISWNSWKVSAVPSGRESSVPWWVWVALGRLLSWMCWLVGRPVAILTGPSLYQDTRRSKRPSLESQDTANRQIFTLPTLLCTSPCSILHGSGCHLKSTLQLERYLNSELLPDYSICWLQVEESHGPSNYAFLLCEIFINLAAYVKKVIIKEHYWWWIWSFCRCS